MCEMQCKCNCPVWVYLEKVQRVCTGSLTADTGTDWTSPGVRNQQESDD